MSYDLMVFEITEAPQTKKEFMRWYEEQTGWSEDHSYSALKVTSAALQNWYEEMKKTFPPRNECDSHLETPDDEAEAYLSDYCIGRHLIYVAFSWSKAEEAYAATTALAQKYGVGFFDVSGDGDIVLPDGREMS